MDFFLGAKDVYVARVAATINIRNECPDDITACDIDQSDCVTCYVLKGGGNSKVEIDVGALWSGIIWGLNSSFGDGSLGYQAKGQANIAEFSIGANGMDFYDLSNVDAYNLPLMINPTSTDTSGKRCPSVKCTITEDLASFCKAPNFLTGPPGNGCKNAQGPNGTFATTGTLAFKSRCPDAYSYSLDDTGATVSSCETGSNSNYEVVFCP